MKLTVKTLKGDKFQVDCEPSNTVAQAKEIIEKALTDSPAASMKLIHSGKVLKDDQSIESCGIKPNDFLVVMITKAKKAAPTAAAATPAPATPAASESKKEESKAAETPAPAPAPSEPPAAPARPVEAEFPAEVVSNLTSMGFPEPEVRHCLRAANGNPDIAVEFLTNGIPPGMQPGEQAAASPRAGASSSGGGPLAALRSHPQFNDLRRLVQSNPQMLQTVLTQIGQQQPELLAEINANQEAFLAMMNEPVSEGSSSAPASSFSEPAAADDGPDGMPAGLLDGMANPAQMAQMLQSMSPNELNQMAAMMGISPDQLRTTAQMLGQMPPEQLQQYMMQAMQSGGGGGMMGGDGGGRQVLRLSEEEMAAVDRLTEMGFDRTEAAQAFLACDKNEALAANLLMDSMGDGGAFGFGPPDDGGNDDGEGDDDDDNMYD